jgi:hypothetical protein
LLLKQFFKILKWMFWIIVLLIIGSLSYAGLDNYFNKTVPTRKVLMTIKYDPKYCLKTHPLRVEITNGSKRKILNSHFYFVVKRKGYSNKVNSFDLLDTDKIIKTNSTDTSCWKMPMFRSEYERYDKEEYYPKLIYSIDDKWFNFE